MKKKVGVIATAVSLVAIGVGGTTAALWTDVIPFDSLPFVTSSATITVTEGSGSPAVSTRPTTNWSTNPAFNSSIGSDLATNSTIARVITVSGTSSAPIGLNYRLNNVTKTGIFTDSRVTMNVYDIAADSECTTSIAKTPVVSGNTASASMDTGWRSLADKPVNAPSSAQSYTKKLCVVLNAPGSTSLYNQTATATGSSDLGSVSDSAQWNATVTNPYPSSGTLGYGVEWNIVH